MKAEKRKPGWEGRKVSAGKLDLAPREKKKGKTKPGGRFLLRSASEKEEKPRERVGKKKKIGEDRREERGEAQPTFRPFGMAGEEGKKRTK